MRNKFICDPVRLISPKFSQMSSRKISFDQIKSVWDHIRSFQISTGSDQVIRTLPEWITRVKWPKSFDSNDRQRADSASIDACTQSGHLAVSPASFNQSPIALGTTEWPTSVSGLFSGKRRLIYKDRFPRPGCVRGGCGGHQSVSNACSSSSSSLSSSFSVCFPLIGSRDY